MASASKKAATFNVYSISPMKARRDPIHAYVFDESLPALAHETPALETASPLERHTTRADELEHQNLSP